MASLIFDTVLIGVSKPTVFDISVDSIGFSGRSRCRRRSRKLNRIRYPLAGFIVNGCLMKNVPWFLWSGLFVVLGLVARPNLFGWAALLFAALLVWPLIWARRGAAGKQTFDKTRIFAAVLLTAFFGFATYEKVKSGNPIENAVGRLMLDPSTAQYRGVKIGSSGITCGEVNGKNVFGAYAGFREFVVVDGQAAIMPESRTGLSVQEQTEYLKEVSSFYRTQRKCYE